MKQFCIVIGAAIASLFTAPACADVGVLVDTRANSSEQFLVTIYTRHADFHNGYSRVRFEGLLPANARQKVAIDFYFSRVGYGAFAYHPDYHVESVITRSRGDKLPALVARRWDAILEDAKTFPYYADLGSPEGPSYFRLLDHVEAYGQRYLPALDRAGVEPDPAVLSRFAVLLAKADALAIAGTESDRRGEAGLKERRARVLPALEKLQALTRSQRLAIAEFRNTTIGPKTMVAALQEDTAYASLLAFIANASSHQRDRLPQEHSWDKGNGLRYTYRLEQWIQRRNGAAPDCARGQLTLDARPIANDASQDLVKRVRNVDFCREPSGRWTIESRTAH